MEETKAIHNSGKDCHKKKRVYPTLGETSLMQI